MKRYIVKNNESWTLVNANQKRTIKKFETQTKATDFALQMNNANDILVQNEKEQEQ